MRVAITLLLSCLPLAAQASFVPFGAGCTFQGQTLAIGNRGLPRLGTSFDITYSGPNFQFTSAQQIAQPFLALGFAAQTFPIPPGLLPMQPAGCTGLIAPTSVFPMPTDPVQPVFASQFTIAVPNQPIFVGVGFLAQWITVFEQCGFAGCDLGAFLTSDAAVVTVGP